MGAGVAVIFAHTIRTSVLNNSPTLHHRAMEEEKKEESGKKTVLVGGEQTKAAANGGANCPEGLELPEEPGAVAGIEEEEDSNFTEEVELPKELRGLKEKSFQFEEELEEELRSRGFPDLPVVLDPTSGKARLKMPTGAHNKVTSEYAQLFSDDWKGIASVVNSDNNVYIQPPQPGRKIYTRAPDIAFWGPDKTVNVQKRGRNMSVPLELDEPPKRYSSRDQVERVNPDVVIQFSWKNGDSYEEKAIDDMMNFALVSYNPPQANNSPPKLGYLIKIRTKANKRTADDRLILRAIDVYRIPQGATKKDAVNNSKGATYSRYEPGGPDVVIRVTPQDLGIPPGTASPRTFDMYASDIFNDLS